MPLGQDLILGHPGYEAGVLTLANNTGKFMDERPNIQIACLRKNSIV
jgi:hypothetical protein